jgi:hypothetical protein
MHALCPCFLSIFIRCMSNASYPRCTNIFDNMNKKVYMKMSINMKGKWTQKWKWRWTRTRTCMYLVIDIDTVTDIDVDADTDTNMNMDTDIGHGRRILQMYVLSRHSNFKPFLHANCFFTQQCSKSRHFSVLIKICSDLSSSQFYWISFYSSKYREISRNLG